MSSPDYTAVERKLAALGLAHRPVAVAFQREPPAGVPKFEGAAPSACSFWLLAREGRVFYTLPADHYNCPVGCYTHNIPLPPERAREMDQIVNFMVEIGYLKMEELPAIPVWQESPAALVYAPLGRTPVAPGVVIFTERPVRTMLLQEAAARAGVAVHVPALGRPACTALPAALRSGVAMSTGCIGSRIYTQIGDDELYVVIRGAEIERVAAEAETIASANASLAEYHRNRKQALAIPG